MEESVKNIVEAGDVGMEPSNLNDNLMQVGSGMPMGGSETIGKVVGDVRIQPDGSKYILVQVGPSVPMTDYEVPQQIGAVNLDCEPEGIEAASPEDVSSSEHSDSGTKQSLKCPVKECNKIFYRPDRLKQHVMLHEHNRPFSCKVEGCNKSYTRQFHLRRHEKTSHKLSPFVKTVRCRYEGCEKTFSYTWNMNKHFRRAHETIKTIFICPECNVTFKKQSKFRAHRENCRGIESTFFCQHEGCKEVFSSASSRKAHHKRHQKYKCPREGCSIILDRWTDLRKHVTKDHPALPPYYKCSLCQKAFKAKSHLRDHMQVHVNEKDVFKCSHEGCSSQFGHKKNLIQHMKNHEKEREMFSCAEEGCGRSFLHKKNLQNHMRVAHLGQRFACVDCDASLSSFQKLKSHRALFHLQKAKKETMEKKARARRKDKGKPKKNVILELLAAGDPSADFSSEVSDEYGNHSSVPVLGVEVVSLPKVVGSECSDSEAELKKLSKLCSVETADSIKSISVDS